MSRFSHLRYPCRYAIAAAAALLIAGPAATAEETREAEASMHGDHEARAGDEPLGMVDFKVSCAEATQPAFDRALSFIHHMMYEQARSAFEQIADDDPECAMAYWGTATTRFNAQLAADFRHELRPGNRRHFDVQDEVTRRVVEAIPAKLARKQHGSSEAGESRSL